MWRLGIRDTTLDISLTDGTREYDLAEDAIQIRAAYYVSSATAGDFHELRQTSIDKLDQVEGSWRQRADESKPSRYYIKTATNTRTAKKQIGFDPIPPTTTSTYPKVVLYVTDADDLQSADTLPTSLQDSQIYLDGMSYLFCKAHLGPNAQETKDWKKEFDQRCQEEAAFINSIARQEVTTYYPAHVSGRAVV